MAVINPYILHLLGGGKSANPKILKELERKRFGTSKRLTEEKEQAAPKRQIKQQLDEAQERSASAEELEDLREAYFEEPGPATRRIDEELTDPNKTATAPQQLDRPEEVWTKYDQEIDEGKISPLEDAEPHLDRIHNELIDKGKLSLKEDYDPDLAPTGPEGIQPRSRELKPKKPVRETTDMTLDELQRSPYTKANIVDRSGKVIIPRQEGKISLEDLEPGEASGLTRTEPTDQIDVLGRNREAALRATIDELPPHLQTPENIRILAREVIQEDVSDKAVGQVFGKSREAHPGVLDPDTEDFNLRSLEDIFVEGVKGDTPQKKAVQRVRKEAAQAAEKSGRSNIIKDKFTGENRYIPQTHRRFIKDPKNVGNLKTNKQQLERILQRPDQAPLEAVQEKLTGPMKPEAAARQVIEGKDQKQKLMELMWKRLGKELRDQPEGLNDAISAEELLMQIWKGMIGN